MDLAFNQHSPRSRHRHSSSTSLNHLTHAPLTSRLPLADHDTNVDSTYHVSYIEGRSAPTTPSILSRSSSRVSLPKPAKSGLTKSKSSTHLLANPPQSRPAITTSGGTNLRREVKVEETFHASLSAGDRSDSDWLLRAGAAISSSTRESKGQSWLVSRASSTSLSGQQDQDEKELQRELSRERGVASRRHSRRGSGIAFDADDEFSPLTRRSLSFAGSRPLSRFGSRATSRRGSKVQLFTPLGGERDGYFDQRDLMQEEEFMAEPDFVDAEEEFFEDEEDVKNDEDIVRKWASGSRLGLGVWVEKMLGWSLFAVEEDTEEGDSDTLDLRAEESEASSRASRQILDHAEETTAENRLPPPADGEAAAWQDAAWLLSIATKVLL